MSTSAIFSGNSRYALDFQQIIDRSVAIASLPLQRLQNLRTNLGDQSKALSDFHAQFTALQTALDNLEKGAGLDSYAASVSDATVVRATVGAGALEGTYTLEVISLGGYTSTMSKDGITTVSDPYTSSISGAASFTLTVNGTSYTISPAGNTLVALVEAINGSGAEVRASIVNIGPSSAPDYRLAIMGTKLAADSIQLNDGAVDLLDTLASGAAASYKVNALPTAIQSDSRTVLLAPGLTVELLAQSPAGQATTITVERSADTARDQLSTFIDAYNAIVTSLDAQHGEHAGALSGQSILSDLTRILREINFYSAASTGLSLADFGVELDQFGKLSLDSAAFDAAAASGVNGLFNFLGSSASSGFLKAASDALDRAQAAGTGVLDIATDSVTAQIDRQDDRIQEYQDRIDQLRDRLAAQMAAADALIASLEQQVNYMTGLFEAMRLNSELLR